MFDRGFINEIASAIVARLPKPSNQRWPELMSIEIAAEYLGREPGGVRHLLEAKFLPRAELTDECKYGASTLIV